MNALRRPAAVRSLLLLATLALLLQFLGSLGTIRPAKDRFDFSSAICLTAGSTNSAAAGSGLPAKDHGHADCKLCCGAGLLAWVVELPGFAIAGSTPLAHAVRLAAAPPQFLRWAPQAARAPPHLS